MFPNLLAAEARASNESCQWEPSKQISVGEAGCLGPASCGLPLSYVTKPNILKPIASKEATFLLFFSFAVF